MSENCARQKRQQKFPKAENHSAMITDSPRFGFFGGRRLFVEGKFAFRFEDFGDLHDVTVAEFAFVFFQGNQ